MLDSDLFRLRDLIKEIQIKQIQDVRMSPRDILNKAKELQFSSINECCCGDCDEEDICPICHSVEEFYSKSNTHTQECELNKLINAVSDMPAYIK